MSPNNLATNILILFVFSLPIFGKQVDFIESVIFYSLPPLLYFYLYQNKIYIKVPQKIAHSEILLLFLLFISCLLSQNIGISYYQFFKSVNILLIFNLSVCLIKPKKFIKYLSIFCLSYSLVFILVKLNLVTLATKPLQDNFIKPIWGHSYLADFLLFFMPILVMSTKPRFILVIFALLVLGLTQSRSALISILPTFFITKPTKKINQTIFIFLTIFILFAINFKILQNQLNFKSLLGSRPEYYSQAVKAFLDKPLLGWGPNNFFLINSIYKTDPSHDSSYAHNYFLNSIAENGLIFTLIFYFYIIKSLIFNFSKDKLFFSLSLLAVAHSWLDPSWHSAGIMVISLYFIFYQKFKLLTKQNNINLNFILVIAIFIFFISKTLSDILFFYKKYQASLFVDPFNLNSRIALITDNKFIPSTLFLYSNHEKVYTTLIQAIPLPRSEKYYYQLFKLNPKQNQHQLYSDLSNYYHQTNQPDKLINVGQMFLNSDHYIGIDDLKTITSLLYFSSVDNYQSNPRQSIKALKLATKLFPDEGHFHVDLANMYWHNNQFSEASDQLQVCLEYDSPQAQCQQYLKDHPSDTPFDYPGQPSFLDYINTTFLTY